MRRTLLVSASILASGAILVMAAARPFIWPPSDLNRQVDAVVVLSGDMGERMDKARDLLAKGIAPTLVHAGSPDSQEVIRMCGERRDGGVEVICVLPAPDNTSTEAQAVASLAESHHWESIAVVTTRWHVPRARILFRRCFDGDVYMVGAHRPIESRRALMSTVAREGLKVAYHLVAERTC